MVVGAAPTQRLVVELLKKALHIILSSRFLAGECEARSTSRSFNLETVEIESVRQAIDAIPLTADWATPVHVDICTSSNEDPAVVLLERWSVSIQSSAVVRMSPGRDSFHDSMEIFPRALILLRSLHSLLRVLPAHNLYSIGQAALSRLDPLPFAIFYFISTGSPDSERTFQDAEFKNFVFAPLDFGDIGCVHMSVFYRASFRYTPAISTPRLSGSKIIPNYITSPSPKSTIAKALIESHSSPIRDRSLSFAVAGHGSNLKPNCSLNTPLFKTAGELQATFTPPGQLPLLDDISAESASNSATKLPLTSSRTKNVSDSPLFTETHFHGQLAISTGYDGLEFARLEPGSDHSQVGELLTIIKQAPERLQSLPQVSLKSVFESLEASLAKNQSLNESAGRC